MNSLAPPETAVQNGISSLQQEWLVERLGTSSDIRANQATGVTKGQLRNWKRNPYFRYLHGLMHSDRRRALQEMSNSAFGDVFKAAKWLMASPRGADKKMGVDIILQLAKFAPEESQGPTFQKIINVLNWRGDLPEGVVDLLPTPMRRLSEQNPI